MQHRDPDQAPVDLVSLPLHRSAAPSAAVVAGALAARADALASALDHFAARPALIAEIAARLVATLRAGGQVLVAGNGGSAAEAQHFAAELVGRFRRERDPYAVLALTADSAILTAVANDYGYEEIFARQVRAFGRAGDLLVAFSTSGESENLIRAAVAARASGLSVIALTGGHPNRLERAADLSLRAPTADTPLVQELHVVLLHLLCDLVEADLAASPPRHLSHADVARLADSPPALDLTVPPARLVPPVGVAEVAP